MKYLVYILLVLVFFTACTSAEKETKQETKKESQVSQLILKGDSGFVVKKEGIIFLKEVSQPSSLAMSQVHENDTIGKYYKNNKGNYVVCFNRLLASDDEFGDYLLVEINGQGKAIRQEDFVHGPYPSCWSQKPLDGFRKYGDFFEFRHCRMVEGYNASFLYIFKEITPQLSMTSIIDYSWSLEDGIQIQSTKEYREDTLIMKYQMDSLYLEVIDEEQMIDSIHVIKMRADTVVFEYTAGKMITKDVFTLQALEIKSLQ